MRWNSVAACSLVNAHRGCGFGRRERLIAQAVDGLRGASSIVRQRLRRLIVHLARRHGRPLRYVRQIAEYGPCVPVGPQDNRRGRWPQAPRARAETGRGLVNTMVLAFPAHTCRFEPFRAGKSAMQHIPAIGLRSKQLDRKGQSKGRYWPFRPKGRSGPYIALQDNAEAKVGHTMAKTTREKDQRQTRCGQEPENQGR